MRRGGRRPRRIRREEVSVWCPGGRWGPRRTRVTECYAVLRAEEVYTALLKDGSGPVRPEAGGELGWTLGGRQLSAKWTIRENAVWRCGRAFLICPRCALRATRLYVPTQDSWLACRRCWGLTYESRTLQNYKDSIWGRGAFAYMFGTTQRDWAQETTEERRQQRRQRSQERWNERREILARHQGGQP